MRIAPVLCTVFALLLGVFASAQTFDRGELRGNVYDKSQAVVPKAKVTLSNPSTGFKRQTETDADGGYTFAQIPPGTYTLLVEAEGFQAVQVKNIEVNIGASLKQDLTLPVKTGSETIEVTAEIGTVDTTTSGINQVINQRAVQDLPLLTQDFRDLAQLSSTAQVVPGLRGGIRLGGQQSDYSNLVIDGTSNYDNFFGEFFGSLETKNFTIPLDAIQEFQVVTNGFAPEFGRATGGLINVVTKSGTNDIHGSFHYNYRGNSVTAADAFGVPSNIDQRHEVGGGVGFPIRKDRQFLHVSFDVQRQHGPLVTSFCAGDPACEAQLAATAALVIPTNVDPANNVLPSDCGGAAAGAPLLQSCYGVTSLAGFEGTHNQFQNLFTAEGRYDYQITSNHHFSARIYGTRNHTSGFTGGRGQNEIQASFGNTEIFNNNGVNGVASLNSVFGPRKVNEIRFMFSGETRPRHPNGGGPEVQFFGSPIIFGQRFFLPINGDDGKVQAVDNFEYNFGKHDIKFGGDVDIFDLRKNIFAGWSKGTYFYGDLAGFLANPNQPLAFVQGFGANGKDIFESNLAYPAFQTGIGLYWQDKWQATPKLTITYGVRWDATLNPQPQTGTPGAAVHVGQGSSSKVILPPQRVPNDLRQVGPRVGFAYQMGGSGNTTVLRGAWGLYYAQTPTIFLPTSGNERGATLFAFFCGGQPASGFPYLYPGGQFPSASLVGQCTGAQSINYVDPNFKNPRVSNLSAGVEHQFPGGVAVSVNYAYTHSWRLRTGGFSSTQWSRNFASSGTDQFGRTIISGVLDPTLGATNELASFGYGNFHQVVFNATKHFTKNYQFFANYTYSKNRDNATSERDTDSFFGPQDPFNLKIDYGRNGLDISHQFKAGAVYDMPWGFTVSSVFIAHSGVPFPAYDAVDANGDGVGNQGFNNDRPVVTTGSKSFLLGRYPANQPKYFDWDFRLTKEVKVGERYNVQFLADLYNVTNRHNVYSNPNNNAIVADQLTATPQAVSTTCKTASGYRCTDQVAPGSTPFALQAGVKFNF